MAFVTNLSAVARTLGDFLPPLLHSAPTDGNGGCGSGTQGSHGRGGRGSQLGGRRARSHSRGPQVPPPQARATPPPVAEQATTWAARCSGSRAWSPRTLQYFAPELRDGVKVVVCPQEEITKAAANWDGILMDYFIGLQPYIPTLANYFKKIWLIKGELQVLSRGNGFLLFKFSDDADKRETLEGGPWFIKGKPLVLRP